MALGLADAPRVAGAYLDLLRASGANVSLLEVTDLRVTLQHRRGPADALRGVSFRLARGDTVG
jgi:hypothetical protein